MCSCDTETVKQLTANKNMDLQKLLEENSKALAKIKIIQDELDGFMKNAFALEPKLVLILEALAKQGLEIADVHFVWCNHIRIFAIPIAGDKFRFKFHTARGYGKFDSFLNKSAIEKKAENMAEQIKQYSGVSRVDVNKDSLELRQVATGSNQILIDIEG